METKVITAGVAVSVMSLASRFIDVPKPIGWAGFSLGAALLLSNFLPDGYQPSPPQGILYLLGIGCLVGALSWQIISSGTHQQTQQANLPAPAPAPLAPPPQTAHDEVLWSGGGGIYPSGIPATTTAYNGTSIKELKAAVDDVSARLFAADADRRKRLSSASSKAGDTAVQRQAEIEKVDGQTIKEFQEGLLMEARPLFDELLQRLKRPYPRTTADGMTVDGYTAISSGILSGPHPLADLAAYLNALASEMKS